MPLTALAFWALYTAGLVGALFAPIVGIMVYIITYHVHPETQWWGDTTPPGLRTSLTIAIATGIGIMLRPRTATHGFKYFRSPMVIGVSILALASLSLLWGVEPSERGLDLLEKLAKVLIFTLMLIHTVRTPRDYQLVLISWCLGVAYIGWQAWHGIGVNVSGRLNLGLGGPDFAESSGLAVHLIATLPIVGALVFMARDHFTRGTLLFIGALAVNTLILTRTRNAVFGLAAISVVGILALPREYRVRGFLGISVGMLLALSLTDDGWWNRMRSITDFRNDESAVRRLDYWSASVQMAFDHPLGIGLGNFQDKVRVYLPELTIRRSAHSTVFETLAELGFLGLALLGLLCLMLRQTLLRAERVSRALPRSMPMSLGSIRMNFHPGWHLLAMRCSLAGYLACSLFVTRLVSEDFWMLVALTCALLNVITLEANAAKARDPLAPLELPETGWQARPALRGG